MCANLLVNLCAGCLLVCESTGDSVCLGANIHVHVVVREWLLLNVCVSPGELF